MDRGLYVAMTGAKQNMQAQAVNNHNIANLSTIGFSADAVSFDSQPIYGAGYATRVNAVAGSDGQEAYTRAGDLRVTPSGAVTTASGLAVLTQSGPLILPPSTVVNVGGDGTVSAVPQGSAPFAITQVD